MEKCPLCGNPCNFKRGEIAIHYFTDTHARFPVSDTLSRYVMVVSPKCLFSYKDNFPTVKGHDFICESTNNKGEKETGPVPGERLKKVIDPNNILKEVLYQKINMSAKENFQEFKQTLNKNAVKNKIKEKKRLEKERKKNAAKEEDTEKQNTSG